MDNEHAPPASRRQFWIAVVIFGVIQGLELLLFILWYPSPGTPDKQEKQETASQPAERELRTQSLSIVTPDGDKLIRLAADPIEWQEGTGPMKRGYMSSIVMYQPNAWGSAIEFQVTPPDGPTVTLMHPRSRAAMIFSCLDHDTFSLSFGGDAGQALRLRVENREKRLTVLDAASRPFVIVDTKASLPNEPRITIRSDLAEPVRVEKHPGPGAPQALIPTAKP